MKKRISVSTKDSIYLIDPEDILYGKCNNSTTTLFFLNEDSITISKGLGDFKKLLDENNMQNKFIRPHQSYLVNRAHITSVLKTPDYNLVLTNKEKIPVSTRLRKEIMELIKIGI